MRKHGRIYNQIRQNSTNLIHISIMSFKYLFIFIILSTVLTTCRTSEVVSPCPNNCVIIRGKVVTGDGTEPFLQGRVKLYMDINTERAIADIRRDGSYELILPFLDAEQKSKNNRCVELSVELDNDFAGRYFVRKGGYSTSMSYEYKLNRLQKGDIHNLPNCYIQRKARIDFLIPETVVFNDKDYLKVTCYGDCGFDKKRFIKYLDWGQYNQPNGLPISTTMPSKSKIFIERDFFINNVRTIKLDSLILNEGGMSIFNLMTD